MVSDCDEGKREETNDRAGEGGVRRQKSAQTGGAGIRFIKSMDQCHCAASERKSMSGRCPVWYVFPPSPPTTTSPRLVP